MRPIRQRRRQKKTKQQQAKKTAMHMRHAFVHFFAVADWLDEGVYTTTILLSLSKVEYYGL